MRKILLLVLMVSLLQVPSYQESVAADLNLEDCRKMGNNSPGEVTRFEDGGHIQDWSNFLKPQGKIKTLVIPIDFPDAPHVTSIDTIKSFGAKISKEFTRLSSSKVSLEMTTIEWVRMPRDGKYYLSANWTQKINDALDAANPVVDFSKYDLVLIKVDEKNSPIDSAGALPMWSEHLGDGIKVLRGAFLGNDFWTRNGQGVQVAVHEIGHVFGLADLYQQNLDGRFPVGIYDLMSTFRLQYELNLLGWNKWKMGWVDESELKCISNATSSLLNFSIEKSMWAPVFIPFEDKVIGIELWSDTNQAKDVFALVYEVTPKTYVWASYKEPGKVSPVQLLKPMNTKTGSGDPIMNLDSSFSPGDFTEIHNLKIKFIGKGKDNFYVSVTPLGQEEIVMPGLGLDKSSIPNLEKSSEANTGGIASKAVGSKKTFFCTKGKITKKFTGFKAKCPAGYKVKK